MMEVRERSLVGQEEHVLVCWGRYQTAVVSASMKKTKQVTKLLVALLSTSLSSSSKLENSGL